MTELTSYSLLFRKNSPFQVPTFCRIVITKMDERLYEQKKIQSWMSVQCTGRNEKTASNAHWSIFCPKIQFQEEKLKKDSNISTTVQALVFAILVHVYLKRKSSKNFIHSPFIYMCVSKASKICSECICCSNAKYDQNLIHIHESGCFFFIVNCHIAPLIYQPALHNILIINHVLRHLDDEQRMKPSARRNC